MEAGRAGLRPWYDFFSVVNLSSKVETDVAMASWSVSSGCRIPRLAPLVSPPCQT